MQWVLRSNNLLLLPELEGYRDKKTFAHYEADTMPGSSGAPALTRMWEVFALHHQAVPAINANGDIVDVDGNPYYGSDDTQVKWLGNEGIRVSALVRFLEAQRSNLSGQQRDRLEEALTAKRPDYIALALKARAGATGLEAIAKQIGSSGMSGKIEFTLPLKISISLGDLTASAVPAASEMPAPAAPKPASPSGATSSGAGDTAPLPPKLAKERDEALRLLERSRTRPYYQQAEDALHSQAYYDGIRMETDRSANFRVLSGLVSRTHTAQPRYAPAKHLYPWIDLYKDGRRLVIKSIYSGHIFEAEGFIEEEFRIEARRERLRVMLRMNEALSAASESMLEELLENSAPYNCEHVVPQSWFRKKEPMRGDLHHLFACESRCNSFRGNHAYYEFAPNEAFMEMCGQRENDQFEPAAGKGAVARATLYFLVRYPSSIDLDESLMDEARIQTLLQWHRGDAVSDHERHRNAGIVEAQGNRNPFVDHPEWADRVDFTNGL